MPAGASFCVWCRIHTVLPKRCFRTSVRKRQVEWGVRRCRGAVLVCRLKLQTPLFVGQFDGTAEQAQLPGNCLRKILVRTKAKRQKVFSDKPDSAGRSANLASRSEFPYGQYPKAQAAQPDQLMSDYFSACRWRCKTKRCFSPSMTRC